MKPIVLAPANPDVTALEKENRALARQAAAEGMVLLENNGVLPLLEKEIALYGAGARMTVKQPQQRDHRPRPGKRGIHHFDHGLAGRFRRLLPGHL